MPDHSASDTRDDLVVDLAWNGALLGALWIAYAAIRSITERSSAVALDNARRLADLQHRLGIGIEQDVQRLIDSTAVLFAANVYYLVHFPLTVTVLVVAFAQSRQRVFSALRNGLIAVTGTAVVIHWAIPLAPPRMLPGYTDAAAMVGPDPYAIPGSEGANQFAAMPSMHVAWAILVGWACWSLADRHPLRIAAVAHPIVTCVVVIVTGHHFVTDVAVGAALAITALVVGTARLLRRDAAALTSTSILTSGGHATDPVDVRSPAVSTSVGCARRQRSRCRHRSATQVATADSRVYPIVESTTCGGPEPR